MIKKESPYTPQTIISESSTISLRLWAPTDPATEQLGVHQQHRNIFFLSCPNIEPIVERAGR